MVVNMTQDEIIEMAKEVYGDTNWTEASLNRLEAFAKLVAAKEREACAKVADEYAEQVLEHNFSKLIANNIRARGQA
jgi:hypothetical protein